MDTKKGLFAIGIVSAAATLFLVWLIYFREGGGDSGAYAWMAALNASLNGLSAFAILLGWLAIRAGERERHRKLMLAAFGFSSLFLVSYIIYHSLHGDSRFVGDPAIRRVYLTILFSHIGLSIVALPMVLSTFFFALTGKFSSHRKLARFTFPIWLYVSVTGVLVFFFLRLFSH